MCGRFNIIDDPFLQALLADMGIDLRLPTTVNIAPTENVPVIRQSAGQRELAEMRWWLVPSWAPQVSSKFSMFNARSETISTSKAFARPYRSQRGIIPASSYIEWQTNNGVKTPWLIKPRDNAMAFAAVWDHWQQNGQVVESCAMLTTAASPAMAKIHHRMPVMLERKDIELWLDNSASAGDLTPLMAPKLTQQLMAYPLHKTIGNSRNKDSQLLQAVGPEKNIDADES
jgi:putative SOS response-associated peptidase YedK